MDNTITARWYQQCWSDRDSKVGSFLYDPRSGRQYSPTFTDSVEFLQWCQRNDWRPESATLNAAYIKVTK